MLCYRDRQWCSFSSPGAGSALRCVNLECSRCITDDDVERATKHELAFDVAPMRNADCGYLPASADAAKDKE